MYVEYLSLYQNKGSGKWDAVVHTNRMIIILSNVPPYQKYACHKNGMVIGFNYDILANLLYQVFGIDLPSVDNLIQVHENKKRVYYATVGVPFIYSKNEGGYVRQYSGCY